jgi:hypothetical protein
MTRAMENIKENETQTEYEFRMWKISAYENEKNLTQTIASLRDEVKLYQAMYADLYMGVSRYKIGERILDKHNGLNK